MRPPRVLSGLAAGLAAVILAGATVGCGEDPATLSAAPGEELRLWASGGATQARSPVAAAGRGRAVVAWSEVKENGLRAAWGTVRDERGRWRTPERLPTDGASVVWDAAIDARGTPLLAIVERARGGARVRIASRDASDGRWRLSEPLVDATEGALVGDVSLAVAADGSVLCSFERRVRGPGGTSVVMAAARGPAGAWGSAERLESPARAQEEGPTPSAAAGAGGRMLVVWERGGAVRASARGDGGTWGPPRRIGGRTAFSPQAGIGPDGGALVVWGATDPASLAQHVEAARRSPAGRWTPARTVYAPGGRGGGTPRLAFGPNGHALVAFGRDADGSRTINAGVRPPEGEFAPAERLSAPLRLAPPPVLPAPAIDEEGRAGVAWTRAGTIEIATRAAGGTWTRPRALARGSSTPALAAAGDAMLVAWTRGGELWTMDVEEP